MKLDRLLAITMALLNQTRVSATDLANRFEVSLRTIYRDMESINQAGIPIVSYPGADGGYDIMSGYRIDKQLLSLDDFTSIITALRGIQSATESPDIESLLERFGALRPPNPSQAVHDHGSVDLDFKLTPNDREKFTVLQNAIKSLRLVRFHYLDGQGNDSERKVEQQFMSRADFSKIQAKLTFDAQVRTRVHDEFGYDPVISNKDGTLSVTAHFSSMEKALQKILSYGRHVQVQDPPAVVAELLREIAAMAGRYSKENSEAQ
ncbi:WYL domain-containing protein [Paenibacillus sp. HB172176]|uniref:helix-turn-helix transcriptional regulator n=1 Tax=Paenibacillus sp. HB172176 TaxID=2493690 RepID=UPI001438F4E9|nr:WYL domain-containing protein [Paenibacillus sp. HB172176]